MLNTALRIGVEEWALRPDPSQGPSFAETITRAVRMADAVRISDLAGGAGPAAQGGDEGGVSGAASSRGTRAATGRRSLS